METANAAIPYRDVVKNDDYAIRVSLEKFKGNHKLYIRRYYKDDTGAFKPTQKGVAVSPEKIPELIQALKDIANESGVELTED